MEEFEDTFMSDEKKNRKLNMDLHEERPQRSLMLWCLAGLYLLYTGYKLCSNVMNGVDGGGIGFFLAGVVFLVLGGGLVFFGLKGTLKADKLRKAREAEAADKAAEEASKAAKAAGKAEADDKVSVEASSEENAGSETSVSEKTTAQSKKKMSIAERAALANRSAEEDTEE